MDPSRSDSLVRPLRAIAVILIMAALYFASDILIPVALAILLAFLLNPLIVRMVRRGLNRVVAVCITVAMACAIVGGIGFFVGLQFVDLGQKLPEYRDNLREKARSFRSAGGPFGKLGGLFEDIKKEIATTKPVEAGAPVKVELVNDGPSMLNMGVQVAGPVVLLFLSNCAVVAVLVIFLLYYSDDIRERLVWFAGMRHMSLTTSTLDEASQRISSYLRMQFIINCTFGASITAGLMMVGLPNALFWGAMGAVLRFVPFVGPWIAAILPTTLAIAISDSWALPIGCVIVFAVCELFSNMVMEPWLYGKSTGISSLGVVFAAIFWGWLWGPLGLILAVPLTVCLLVFGKQVPQLAVLHHLFGESEEMPKAVRLYQRLLVGDELTAGKLIEEQLGKHTFTEVCQDLLMPVLQELKRDMQTGMVDQSQARRAMTILDVATTGAIVPAATAPSGALQAPMLFIAAQDEVDDMAATLLARAAVGEGVAAEIISSRALASEAVERARQDDTELLCLVQVAPISWTHCRHLAKTLASRLPNVTLYAANIEPGNAEAPFACETTQLPAKRLFRDVTSLMNRLRESRFVEPKSQSPAPVLSPA